MFRSHSDTSPYAQVKPKKPQIACQQSPTAPVNAAFDSEFQRADAERNKRFTAELPVTSANGSWTIREFSCHAQRRRTRPCSNC